MAKKNGTQVVKTPADHREILRGLEVKARKVRRSYHRQGAAIIKDSSKVKILRDVFENTSKVLEAINMRISGEVKLLRGMQREDEAAEDRDQQEIEHLMEEEAL